MNKKEFVKMTNERPDDMKAWYNKTAPDAMKILIKKMGTKELTFELNRSI